MNTKSKAYRDGYRDGLAWDLDGFDSRGELLRARQGWDEATINAIGSDKCAAAWGVRAGTAAWERACDEYNAGAYAGATAPQSKRRGAEVLREREVGRG